MFNLIVAELKKRVTAVIGWGVGIGAYLAMIVAMSPDLAPQFANLDLSAIPIYKAFGITENFLSIANLVAIYVSFLGLTIAIYAVITGTSALAGEEEDGTLETLMSLPLARWQIVLAKVVAIAIALLVVLLIAYLGYLAVFPSVKADLEGEITLAELFWSTLESRPLAMMFAMLSLFMGAYLPRRNHALGVGLTVLIGGYLFNNLAEQAGPLKDLRPFFPFYYNLGGKVLTEGVDLGKVGVLVAAAA
ncbi:MAG: ABC transporter permease subunit, partial [Anaerolineales bacterium]|nr:ABC transporter permease subunit [Anaerolineales bacterium]